MSTERQQEHLEPRVEENEDVQPTPVDAGMDEEFTEDLDALLDEIDEILEEDSEEFVENYIQRGGQ